MSADIAGLVETSTNVAIIRSEPKKITLITSQRSSVASELDEIQHTVGSIFELAGAEVDIRRGLPRLEAEHGFPDPENRQGDLSSSCTAASRT